MEVEKNDDGRPAITSDEVAVIQWVLFDNKQAFKYIIDHHYKGLYLFIKKQVKDDDLAADIVQEIFTKLVHEKKAHLLAVTSLKSYLASWSRNLLLNQLKKKAMIAQAEKEHAASMALDWKNTGVEEHLLYDKNIHELASEFMPLLTERQQQVFVYHRVKSLTYPQIAKLLNVTEFTARKHGYDGLFKLKHYVATHYGHYLYPTTISLLIYASKLVRSICIG